MNYKLVARIGVVLFIILDVAVISSFIILHKVIKSALNTNCNNIAILSEPIITGAAFE